MRSIRQRLEERGCDALTPAELWRVVCAGRRLDPVPVMQAFLDNHWPANSQAPLAVRLQAWEALRERWLEQSLQRQPLDSSDRVRAYLCHQLGRLPREQVLALYLDTRLRLLCSQTVALGTINEARLYPRELVRGALENGASHLVLAHNHPSGQRAPSASDVALTDHVESILAGVDVTLVDHFVVTASGIESIKRSNKAA